MGKQQQIHLLFNEENHHHEMEISKMILGAKHLECVIAFAKMSGLKHILNSLEKGLGNGLTARFTIGLSFYQSEPKLLRELLSLTRSHHIKLYISKSDGKYTFHPKIYAVSNEEGSTVLIGSANLTEGGLMSNCEASAQVSDLSGTIMQSIKNYIDKLIEQKELLEATNKLINKYERSYEINKWQQRFAQCRTKKAIKQTDVKSGVQLNLSQLLLEMKNDTSENGFKLSNALRKENREAAKEEIKELASLKNLTTDNFKEHYESLISLFHSGGLHRGKNIVAENAGKFQMALIEILKSPAHSPQAAYELLNKHFKDIPRVGVNVMTEILHVLDSDSYAVMNQNAVHGLRLANISNFPKHPSKDNVDAVCYAHFCQQAKEVMKELGLENFTELDSLLNYAYWEHSE